MQGVQGTVRECLFESNVADFGGAIFRGSTTGDITGSVFSSNKATKIGGAIYDSHAKVRAHTVSCIEMVACMHSCPLQITRRQHSLAISAWRVACKCQVTHAFII